MTVPSKVSPTLPGMAMRNWLVKLTETRGIRGFYSCATLTRMQRPLNSALVWFRRDLRAVDNAALHHALRSARTVWCVFVFDTEILEKLPRVDRRVDFILASLQDLDGQLR